MRKGSKVTKRKKSKGFTLIELLVVVAIVGILAAIAIPQFAEYRRRGFNARVEADARNAATAQEAYFVDNNTYLTSGDCSALPGMSVSDGVTCTLGDNGSGGFTVDTSHPEARISCTWDSGGSPNLTCTAVASS